MRVAMRRVLILLSSLMLLQIASDAWPQSTSIKLSGLGYIDYRSKPRFKVGDWVKYHFSSQSDGGKTEDHDLTILITGEEKFWGDECFWVETWSGGRTLQPSVSTILMSYSVFGDTAWLQHLQVYQRKSSDLDEDRHVVQELTRRVLGGKTSGEGRSSVTVLTDTLGPDTTSAAGVLYRCQKVGRRAGVGSVDEVGDSTIRNENWDKRTLYLSPRVPMTSLVKELDERWITRKAWKVGKSADAVLSYRMRGTGTLELIAFGSGGLEPRATPYYARKTMARGGTAPAGRPKAKPALKPAVRKRT